MRQAGLDATTVLARDGQQVIITLQMPMLYIMCGIGFAGKSTLAKKIAEHTGATLISQDSVYWENEKKLNFDQDSDDDWEIILGMCKGMILDALKSGSSVVFDNVNLQVKDRDDLRTLAGSAHAQTMVIYLDTPLQIQKERQLKNKETKERHDVKQEYLDDSIEQLEVPTESENVRVFAPDADLEAFLASLK